MHPMDAYAEYMTNHLPSLCGRPLLPGVDSLSVCFEIALTDMDVSPWRIVIENGRLVSVTQEGPEPACRFDLDCNTMLRLVSGEEPPAVAFFENRVDISGDVETGLTLSTVLEPFFRLYPFPLTTLDSQHDKDV